MAEPGRNDRLRLRDELVRNYSRARLEVELGHLDQNLEAISTDHDLPTIVSKVIADARRRGWLSDLLDWAAKEPYPELAAVARALRNGLGTAAGADSRHADPWTTTIIGGRPFLGRGALRTAMRELVGAGPRRVLTVDGPRGSGRSYTWIFVSHLAGRYGTFRPVLVDLARAGDFGPAYVIEQIRLRLGLPAPDVDPQAGAAQRADWLAGRLYRRAATDYLPMTLVLDGLDQQPPTAETTDMIRRFLEMTDHVPDLRVILLGCPRMLADARALHEQLTYPTTADVTAHLHEVAAGMRLHLEPGASDEFVAWVLRDADADPPPVRTMGARVRRLDAALHDWARR